MIPIHKCDEPRSWLQFRNNPGVNFDDGPKSVLHESLIIEQRFLCAYCCCKLVLPTEGKVTRVSVEHWAPQSRSPTMSLDYKNMLAVCSGKSGEQKHCDESKKNQSIELNPSNPKHHARLQIRYDGTGKISSADTTFDVQINQVLNLNFQRLKDNRRGVLKRVNDLLSKKSGTATVADLERYRRTWHPESGPLPEYCGVALYFFDKRIKRLKE